MNLDDWDIEIEQEPFKCPLCKHTKYKPVSAITNKKKDTTTVKASGLIKNIIAKKSPDIQICKDFAECVNCSNRVLLSETETIVPKETRKEAKERMAKVKFDGNFLSPEQL